MFDMNNQDKLEELEAVDTTKQAVPEKQDNKTGSACACKLKSAKLWVTIWSILMVTFIVLTNKSDFVIIAQWLCGVPLAYIGANVWQKQIFSHSAARG